jgi:hypothetical protein
MGELWHLLHLGGAISVSLFLPSDHKESWADFGDQSVGMRSGHLLSATVSISLFLHSFIVLSLYFRLPRVPKKRDDEI